MKKLFYLLLCISITFAACKKNDPPLADNLLSFSAASQGLESDAASATITLNLSRATDVALPLTLNLAAAGVTYGTEFTTEPAAANASLDLIIPAGSSSVSFKLKKTEGVFLNGNESVSFTIKSVANPVIIGGANSLLLSFSAITSSGATLTLNGGEGGSGAVNSVFVDLSANAQNSVLRSSWDLGFYNGEDFRVILNNAAASSAVMVNKTDINAVSESDVDITTLQLGFGKGTFDIIDDVEGDLNKTVIARISATDNDNKVYVINRLGGSGTTAAPADLYKIRILRADGGYSLQYAKLTETTFKTISISKSPDHNFNYVSFDPGTIVNVAPSKDHWDLEWTYSVYTAGSIPYVFSDLVFTNYLAGVQAAEVLTGAVSYNAFSERNIDGITFSSSRNTISSNWRNTTGAVGVKTDRFYLIKDASGNIYKLRFNSFTTQDGGTRGYPVIEYALVKKGV